MKSTKLVNIVISVLNEMWDSQDSDVGSKKMSNLHKEKLDAFTNAYMNAALMTSNDNLEDNGGNSLDKKYTIDDYETNCFNKMTADCKDFQSKYSTVYQMGDWSDEEAGTDFWLTRNGHGTGFWDKSHKQPEQEKIGIALTQACKSYGTFDLYLCGESLDGLICGS